MKFKIFILVIIFFLLFGCKADSFMNASTLTPPSGFPVFEEKGMFLVSINVGDQNFLSKFNSSGKLIWYTDRQNNNSNNLKKWQSFHKTQTNGIYYYMETSDAAIDASAANSELVIFDDAGKQKNILYEHNNTFIPVDAHEADVFNFNHYIAATSSHLYNKDSKMHSWIQEVKNNKNIWKFDSSKYPYLEATRTTIGDVQEPVGDSSDDYMHFNSFAIDPADNNLLVSYRNLSSIIKIDRKTGEILFSMNFPKIQPSVLTLFQNNPIGKYI